MARRAAVEVDGLSDFRKALRGVDNGLTKELAAAHRTIAREVTAEARGNAASMGGQQRHFAKALQASGTTSTARVVVGGPRTPSGKSRANPAFWGRKSQGNWIGTAWDVGGVGGPYAINPAVRDFPIERKFGDAIDAIARRAFPD